MRGTTVTIRRAVRDRSGDRVNETTHEVTSCIIAPRSTSEGDERGVGLIVGYTLYAPYDADIQFDDRVEFASEVWDVQGQPFKWASPYSGKRSGLQVELRKAS